MGVFRIADKNMSKISPLYDNWNETLIWSCLQGYMGTAWADDETNPRSAQIVIADFCIYAGVPNEALVRNRPPEYLSDFVIMVPQNQEWAALIESVYGKGATAVTRYAIKKETDVFDREKLQSIVENTGADYCLRMIDEDIYNQAMANRWSRDLCSQFADYREYSEKGLGAAILHKGELVAGASSYTVYRGGIEIEIDTRSDYRRKGLALACGARLILACMDRELYPSWDAQNKGSVALAENLGYHFDKEYVVYEVSYSAAGIT